MFEKSWVGLVIIIIFLGTGCTGSSQDSSDGELQVKGMDASSSQSQVFSFGDSGEENEGDGSARMEASDDGNTSNSSYGKGYSNNAVNKKGSYLAPDFSTVSKGELSRYKNNNVPVTETETNGTSSSIENPNPPG